MRLHVGEPAAEQPLRALHRQRLDGVGESRAAVVAVIGQTLDGLVGENRALRLQHQAGDDVFRRNQLDAVALAVEFAADGRGQVRVGVEPVCEVSRA